MSKAFTMRLTPDMVARIDKAKKKAAKIHLKQFPWWGNVEFSRSEAIRNLLRIGLSAMESAEMKARR